jgi:signal transduction histidine kinase/CheY-like chemotaxis protein
MQWETVSSLGEYLNVDRCLWHEIDWEHRTTTVERTWQRADMPDVTGIYALEDYFTPDQLRDFAAGQTMIVCDVKTHPVTAPYAHQYLPLGAAAFVSVPCIHAGRWISVLAVNSRTLRHWRSDEIALLQDIVARLWLIIEQTKAVQVLRQTAEDLVQANRLKDEFLAALSHELRTPLNPILGWTTMMQAQKLTPTKTTEALDTIKRNVRQQIRLIDDLLDISSVIQGKLKLEFRSVDLALTIQSAIDTVQFAAQAKAITLELHGLPTLNLIADRDRLQQVFWNLLSNAIKFTPEGGRVEINLATIRNGNTNRYAQVLVTDTGIGIAPKFLPHVFDRFRQADSSSTRKYGGLGLGLSIVRHLVELHGGTVNVDSPGIGQGATFTVKLPIKTDGLAVNDGLVSIPDLNPSEPVLHPHLAQAQPSSTTSLTGVRILIVDDDPDNLDLLSFLLQQEGATITAVTSPLKALELTAKQPLDLIISDIGMPELDGYELIQKVRALPQGQSIPALALTAFAYQEDQEKAIQAGFQAYITKPINPIKLLAVLTQLLNC